VDKVKWFGPFLRNCKRDRPYLLPSLHGTLTDMPFNIVINMISNSKFSGGTVIFWHQRHVVWTTKRPTSFAWADLRTRRVLEAMNCNVICPNDLSRIVLTSGKHSVLRFFSLDVMRDIPGIGPFTLLNSTLLCFTFMAKQCHSHPFYNALHEANMILVDSTNEIDNGGTGSKTISVYFIFIVLVPTFQRTMPPSFSF
jgi:hypothetical protein